MLSRRRIIGLAAAAAISARAASRARTVGVDESGFVPIGGIDQWIATQGRDADNPAIVYLHGGPGEAQSPFLEEFAQWERSFTVVNWDQRGSGKTYGKYGAATLAMATAEQAVETLTRDAIAVVEYAQRRLRKRKVILVGQSWGSILGLLAVKRRPDLFYAYVGTGFEVSWLLSTQARESWARSEAQRTGDRATLNALDAAAKAYVAAIHAPRKAFIPIDGGHFACFTDPVAFVGALQKYVDPRASRLHLKYNQRSEVE